MVIRERLRIAPGGAGGIPVYDAKREMPGRVLSRMDLRLLSVGLGSIFAESMTSVEFDVST